MYRVVKRFVDLRDAGRVYEVGDKYPRTGVEVSMERLEELSSSRNRRGVVLIVNDSPEEASPVATEAIEEAKTDVDPPTTTEAKRRPRRGQRKNA